MLRRQALLVLGSAFVVAVALGMGLAQHLPVICPLRCLTGIPCASCGLTRAAAALCHGQLAAASACNLAAIPLALFLAAVLLLLCWEAVKQRPMVRPFLTRYAGVLTWSAVALLSVAWGVNLHRHLNDDASPPATAMGPANAAAVGRQLAKSSAGIRAEFKLSPDRAMK